MTNSRQNGAGKTTEPGRRLKRSKEEIILLMLCSLSIPSILPFGIYRLLHHTWLQATIDLVIVGGVSSVMAYVWFTRRVRAASLIVTVFYSFGMVATIYVKGIDLVYWAYPTMVSAFFLLRPNIALLINGCSLTSLVTILASQVPLLNLLTIAITFVLINMFSYIFSHRTAIQHKELHTEAERDFLTGVGNRRALEDHLNTYVVEFDGRVESSLLLLDIDHFKSVNDQFGHAVGDAVLKRLCELMRSRTRNSDRIFRYGGEEFIIIANGANLQSATGLAEDLRELVARTTMVENYPITISIGVACLKAGMTATEWLAQADAMMYLAKHSGRNAVRVAQPTIHSFNSVAN